MADFSIRAERLTKNYDKHIALDGLTAEIPAEGIIGLVGRNGSGKTTFMKICAGILNFTEGKIDVWGGNPMDNFDILSNIVYTYHNMEYENYLPLKEIIRNYKVMYKDFDSGFALKLIKYFDLKPEYKYKQISQGMASIFNFICGLSCRTLLTMFDEPVLGMDVTVRKAAYEVLLRDYSEYPRAIIISSHLLSEIEGVLSDILLIDRGKNILWGSVDDLRQSAYRVEGKSEALREYCASKKVIHLKNTGINDFAVIHEPVSENVINKALSEGLSVSAVRPEDLCIYLTRENKEGELECLWNKTN